MRKKNVQILNKKISKQKIFTKAQTDGSTDLRIEFGTGKN